MDFTNKVVIVTGASSGIGAETAKHFGSVNAKLVLTGRSQEALSALVDSCPGIKDPLVLVGDLLDEEFIKTIVPQTLKKFGQLDVLVNNAGIFALGTIENTSMEQYDSIMNTNVRTLYHLTTLAVPHLIKTKGNIVNVSSVAGLRSFVNTLAYCVSKAAVDQVTRCVALELADKGVRVNAVNPGAVLTNIQLRSGMNAAEFQEYLAKSRTTHPMGRIGTVAEVANSIVFLASDSASFITAATLPIDGGKHVACPR